MIKIEQKAKKTEILYIKKDINHLEAASKNLAEARLNLRKASERNVAEKDFLVVSNHIIHSDKRLRVMIDRLNKKLKK